MKRSHCLCTILLMASMFLMFGCASFSSSSTSSKHSSSLIDGSFDHSHIAPYSDYEPIQLIFVSTEDDQNIDVPHMTYLLLLKEASKLGGNGIINVTIEESKNCVKNKVATGIYEENEVSCKVKRFGAALAVKFTKPINDNLPLVPPPQNAMTAPDDKSESKSSSGLSLGSLF